MLYILILIFDIFLFQLCISRILPSIQYFEELFTIIISILALCITLKKYKYKKNKVLINTEKKVGKYLFLFLVVGFISTIFYHEKISTIGILKDVLASSKAFISYISVLIVFEKVNKEKLLNKIAKRARLYISVIFIFGILNLFLDIGMASGTRYGIRCYEFLYTHPTYLAFSVIILMCILIANGRSKDKIYIVEACIILISTGRSKAFVFIFAYLLINLYLRFSKKIKIRYLVFIMLGGLFITLTKIIDYFSYGLTAARPALYIIGTKIMVNYFPIGTGFCTFASSLSAKYYSPVYEQYGINLVSGLTIDNSSYISDTFWPYIYGQFGIIGLILFIFILLNIYKSLKSRYSYSTNKLKAINLLFFYLLFASTAEAIFIDVTGQFALIVLAIFIGNNIGKNKCEEMVELNIQEVDSARE